VGQRFSGICESPRKLSIKSATVQNWAIKKPAQLDAKAGHMPIALAEFVMRPQAEESNRRELTIYLIMFMLSS
jgi:hypothetical protein